MNKNDELVIKYLSGELNENERLSFELQLNHSGKLNNLVKKYSVVFDKFDEQKVIEGNHFYFINLLTGFRRSSKQIKSKFSYKSFVYGLTVMLFTIISYTLFNSANHLTESVSLELLTDEINKQQASEIIDRYSLIDKTDFNFANSDTLFENEINSFYNSVAVQAVDEIELRELTNQLSQNEINLVYSDLISKKIF